MIYITKKKNLHLFRRLNQPRLDLTFLNINRINKAESLFLSPGHNW